MFVSSSFNTYVNLPKKRFFLFFYATDIFWTVTKRNYYFFGSFDMLQKQGEEEIGHQGIFCGNNKKRKFQKEIT
jgi:hypothetical protein